MQDSASILFYKNDRPHGITYENWTILWWKWLVGIPRSTNPAMDLTGENANLNQPDRRVFFLCQTIEGVQSIPRRTISIPFGTMLLMPIINWLSIGGEDGNTDNELSNMAKKKMDNISNLQFSINDCPLSIDLENCRMTSSPFHAYFPPNNIFDIAEPNYRPVLSDGYWIFLKPLKSDSVLTTYGSCSKGLTKIGISYKICLVHE